LAETASSPTGSDLVDAMSIIGIENNAFRWFLLPIAFSKSLNGYAGPVEVRGWCLDSVDWNNFETLEYDA
jgi:hypothetical protein